MKDEMNRIDMICAEILEKSNSTKPLVGLVLGSGLGQYAEAIENPVAFPYVSLPDFPVSTIAGHAGRLVIGQLCGKTVIAMQGRIHMYEGYRKEDVILPVRVMARLGIKTLILTNAAGGVTLDFEPGTLMLIRDHINFSGVNPLSGPNMEQFGPRFPDMSEVYSKCLRERLLIRCREKQLAVKEGIYMMFHGPSFETPAEIRMARALGADAVGMSTVLEAIAARHAGLAVLGISCITNFAAGVSNHVLSHEKVMETTSQSSRRFSQLLDLAMDCI